MNEAVKKSILDKIKEYDSIVIGRHFRPDGDAIGSTRGLKRIIQLTYPEKKVYLCNSDYSDYLSFLGEEDGVIPEEVIQNSLGIIIDVATADRVSNPSTLNAKELIKIDHHIDIKPYGDISWVEDERSAACEMIADFYRSFQDELKIDEEAATYIYCGMVTDSGHFRFSSTSGDTMRLAGLMMDQGVKIEPLYAHLDLENFNFLKYKGYMLDHANITENGVAWLYVDKAMQEKWHLTREQASESVGFLNSIKGSLCWIALIDNEDGTIRVRLRSRFMTINKLAEKYHGGGHDRASGATCYSKEEMEALIQDADALIKEYKENNEGWL